MNIQCISFDIYKPKFKVHCTTLLSCGLVIYKSPYNFPVEHPLLIFLIFFIAHKINQAFWGTFVKWILKLPLIISGYFYYPFYIY